MEIVTDCSQKLESAPPPITSSSCLLGATCLLGPAPFAIPHRASCGPSGVFFRNPHPPICCLRSLVDSACFFGVFSSFSLRVCSPDLLGLYSHRYHMCLVHRDTANLVVVCRDTAKPVVVCRDPPLFPFSLSLQLQPALSSRRGTLFFSFSIETCMGFGGWMD